jgi:chromosome segregation ATPase
MEKASIGTRTFKKFFRKLVIASSKLKERERAREEISTHITKIKRLAAHPRTKKETVTAELEILNQRVAEVIEGEKTMQKRIEKLETKAEAKPPVEKKREGEEKLLEMEKQIYDAEKKYLELEKKGVKDEKFLEDLKKRIDDSKKLLDKLKSS